VSIPHARLSVTVHGEDLRNELLFTCPECGVDARQRVGERATRLLGDADITIVSQTSAPVDTGRGATEVG
jgi:hypothetical protein